MNLTIFLNREGCEHTFQPAEDRVAVTVEEPSVWSCAAISFDDGRIEERYEGEKSAAMQRAKRVTQAFVKAVALSPPLGQAFKYGQ